MKSIDKYFLPALSVVVIGLLVFNSLHNPNSSEPGYAKGINPKTDKISVRSGFKVEHLFSPSDDSVGSWVSMTFDNKGRMICSDQYGALYRMEVPPIGDTVTKLQIERLYIGKPGDSLDIGSAHGLLYAFNSLYVMVNAQVEKQTAKNSKDYSPRESGLYRVQDLDGDDQYDAITLLKALKGHGEHGPHSIILSPDSASLYLISGNHTDLPAMDAYRLPSNWQEDNILPLIKDPRGHANDRMAPGGWVAKVDPEGKKWELVSAGFRNAFDIAFNETGDLFAYDADMEYDMGLPWYRPTRINHVTSGSEFGWRTGNSKWSPSFPDNLPAVINIGQGSPTSLLSLRNAKLPLKYKKSLLAFDWTFGIIHLIKLKPSGSTFLAEREEFLSGVPLPLTDGVVGPDGALYFMIGGRRLESDVYRVYYAGNEKADGEKLEGAPNPLNQLRRSIEQYHQGPNKDAVNAVWPYLKHNDRFIRYAARIALEHQPIAAWKDRALQERDPVVATEALVGLIRQADASLNKVVYTALLAVNNKRLNEAQQINLLRAYELAILRLGMPDGKLSTAIIAQFDRLYPSNKSNLDRSLSRILIALEAPGVISRTLALMETTDKESIAAYRKETATASDDLIMRNPGYGLQIANLLNNLPPAQQTYMATMLSRAKNNWTPELQDRYFAWYKNAFAYRGGHSYVGFLDRSRKYALDNVAEGRRGYCDTLSGAGLLTASGNDLMGKDYPKGPGRNWKVDEAVALFEVPLEQRNFHQGRAMYMATTCNRCHAMGGEGGNIGPNLTSLGKRFSMKDMLEAIIEPSKTISDQYAATQFTLANGSSIIGRLTDQDNKSFAVSRNPYSPEQLEKVNKKDVVSMRYSPISSMLPGLINSLNEEELKDLMAYLMTGGNEKDPVFKEEGSK